MHKYDGMHYSKVYGKNGIETMKPDPEDPNGGGKKPNSAEMPMSGENESVMDYAERLDRWNKDNAAKNAIKNRLGTEEKKRESARIDERIREILLEGDQQSSITNTGSRTEPSVDNDSYSPENAGAFRVADSGAKLNKKKSVIAKKCQ